MAGLKVAILGPKIAKKSFFRHFKLIHVCVYYKLECWQLTCQFPTGQSPAWSNSDRRNYDSRKSDQQTQGLTENRPPFIRKHYVVISSQSPFAANVVPKLVAMATSLRHWISAMLSSDSITPNTHP